MPCRPQYLGSRGHENRAAHSQCSACAFYAVISGRIVAVFSHASVARLQTDGVSGSHHQRLKEWDAVEDWWARACPVYHQGGCPQIEHPPTVDELDPPPCGVPAPPCTHAPPAPSPFNATTSSCSSLSSTACSSSFSATPTPSPSPAKTEPISPAVAKREPQTPTPRRLLDPNTRVHLTAEGAAHYAARQEQARNAIGTSLANTLNAVAAHSTTAAAAVAGPSRLGSSRLGEPSTPTPRSSSSVSSSTTSNASTSSNASVLVTPARMGPTTQVTAPGSFLPSPRYALRGSRVFYLSYMEAADDAVRLHLEPRIMVSQHVASLEAWMMGREMDA
ncbi:hypothetical protein FB45DRAFT_948878 [Roridomyces roridus]|uniref:Uncharacterized protein n=1 Tax=Roridomyces roridus TaxID=1738132 RepID=A0AAD7B1B4_9AGAR|nr:hypothetical protein FB45DRAFT_948878 [Roridomyces roridus]